MSITFDIIIVFILIVSIYGGYKKGIVDVGFKLVAIILSLLVSIILYSPITHFVVNNTQIDEKIEEIIIKNGIVKSEQNSNETSGIDAYIQNYAKDLTQETQNAVVEAAAKPISASVVGIGVMILLFLVTRIILTILKTFTDVITKIPILKQCNEIAGLAYGILRGLVIVYGILALLFFIVSISGGTTINTAIESSYITKFFYNNNLILMMSWGRSKKHRLD